jgi:myosin heavy subunit
MGDKGKTAVIILVLLMLFALSLAGTGFYLLQGEHKKNVLLQKDLQIIKDEQASTLAKLNESLRNIAEMEDKLREAKDKIDTLAQDFEKEKLAKEETLTQMAQLKSDMDKQKALRLELEAKLTQSQNEAKSMQAKLNELDAQKKDLETKVKDLEARTQQVELGTIIVSPEAQPETPKTAPAAKRPSHKESPKPPAQAAIGLNEGKIIVVNKEYNFAVINLGGKDGLKIGDVFSVYRDNKVIGSLKVEKVHDSMAAAAFSSPEMKDKLSEGDRVVKKR